MLGGSYRGGIAEAEKFQQNGFYCLSWTPASVLTSGDLGRGGMQTTARFQTEEGRMYFMQAEALREQCAALVSDLEWAQRQLREIAEKKERRRKKRMERLGKAVK